MMNSSLGVRYFHISGSLNCALRCVGISRAKTIGVELHFEVVLKCSGGSKNGCAIDLLKG